MGCPMNGYVMGIDGGGSNLRVVVATPDLQVVGESHAGTVNPSVIGRETAAGLIRQHMWAAITNAHLQPADIRAVCIGVAGASADHSADWLCEVVGPITPNAKIRPSADQEIALVGAHGKREGILILAGTGSVAYGVNPAGQAAAVGGWGYLLGDEGSGYWLGMSALRAISQASERRAAKTTLTESVLHELNLEKPRDLIRWLYAQPRNAEIAQLAPLIIQQADAGDAVANCLVGEAIQHLAGHVTALRDILNFPDAPIAFAGGLLTHPNALSSGLGRHLQLPAIPVPLYPPVIGAVLLALDTLVQSEKES
ncbi:MAG: hypothetical protein D8M56_01985 [Chloroflexi bacterium]|nr:hypothetical protein [Chloroflexota bacterium]